MKIAVCMKQVPRASEGNMDPETGILIRSGLESITNTYDLSALEAALRIKELIKCQVHVFSMGPAKAKDVIREAYAFGADEGYLISDAAFGGADVLSTSYALMEGIKTNGNYDLIICGEHTTDGDTGQVSSALASWFEMPCVGKVEALELSEEDKAHLTYTMDGRKIQCIMKLPGLISVKRESFIPRIPSLKAKLDGRKKDIHLLTLKEMGNQDKSQYGLLGAATKVCKIYPPERTEKQPALVMNGNDGANYLFKILKDGEAMNYE